MTDLNTHANTDLQLETEGQTQQQLTQKLKSLKELDLENASVSLWVIHRTLARGVARYSALRVEADEPLRRKLRSVVVKKVEDSNDVEPYDYITADLDDCVLEQPVETTDFGEIITFVNRNGEEHRVEKPEQLMSAWGYVIKLQIDDAYAYAFRKLGQQWSSKKVRSGLAMLFRDQVLLDLDEPTIFKADSQIDFIGFDGSLFILNKSNFESAMNFREGMKRHRDEIIQEFDDLGLFNHTEVIKEAVGDNLHKLRRLAAVKKSGYYRLPWYIERVKELNTQQGWGLTFTDEGAIEAAEDNVDLILTLLNNDRLKSPITDEIFDVAVKKAVEANI